MSQLRWSLGMTQKSKSWLRITARTSESGCQAAKGWDGIHRDVLGLLSRCLKSNTTQHVWKACQPVDQAARLVWHKLRHKARLLDSNSWTWVARLLPGGITSSVLCSGTFWNACCQSLRDSASENFMCTHLAGCKKIILVLTWIGHWYS